MRRAGFALIAGLAVHNKTAADSYFGQFFPLFIEHSGDDRNFVKKAVNWALRSIGKRNAALNRKAIVLAQKIQKQPSRAARWIAADALRELQSNAIQVRLRDKLSR